MRQFETRLLLDLEELNSSEFQLLLTTFPKIVSIIRIPDEKNVLFKWAVVLEK